MSEENYVIGLDFGTDSVRAVLVRTSDGQCVNSSVAWYSRWKTGAYCNPSENQFRQHPLDHIEGMEQVVREVVDNSKLDPGQIKGICIDTTGSSPVPVARDGQPLAMSNMFSENANAMMVLWKDHTSIAEADEINQLARTWGGEDFTRFEGGIYSSEWFWAKILHIIRTDEKVRSAAWSWMEHCDLMTYLLTGSKELKSFKRSRCAAGHKAMWHESWGGLPDDQFLKLLDPYLVDLKKNLYHDTYTSDEAAGTLSEEWASKMGLTTETIIAVGTFDAHAGAVGAEVDEHVLVRVMGTSTCDIIVSSETSLNEKTVEGICGQVAGSVIPGMTGLEAGQSAFGDLLAWFSNLLIEPSKKVIQQSNHLGEDQKNQLIAELEDKLIVHLSEEAEKIPLHKSVPVSLDWINGRRTPDANQNLKSTITGLNLGTQAPEIFRSLVEAICFGSKAIVDRFQNEGVEIKKVVGIGGVAKKSGFVMQTLADVLDMPISIATSDQAPALGAAMYAAVASGIYENVEEAIQSMGNGFEKTYQPNPESVEIYRHLYLKYQQLASFTENFISGK